MFGTIRDDEGLRNDYGLGFTLGRLLLRNSIPIRVKLSYQNFTTTDVVTPQQTVLSSLQKQVVVNKLDVVNTYRPTLKDRLKESSE